MRRWNGWGDDSIEMELGEEARAFLFQRLGQGMRPDDAGFEALFAGVGGHSAPSIKYPSITGAA